MDNSEMTRSIRRLFDELYSKGNVRVCDELFANNLKLHDAAFPNAKSGLASYKEIESTYATAFPNKKAKIDDIYTTNDNKVIVRWTCEGKHDGRLQDISATHRPFRISGISIYQFTNGKITEIWQVWDRLGLFEQLGVIQPAHALH